MSPEASRYDRIIERVFLDNYSEGASSVPIERPELHEAADALGVDRVKNLGDLISTYRYRKELPESVRAKAPDGKVWVIRGAGTGRYRFDAADTDRVVPNTLIGEVKVLDATPGMITKYALSAEQSLLAKVRYNRLIDLFTGITCYSLQSHLQTQVSGLGQVETDEVYLGVDRTGAHYVLPVQAKGGKDRLSIVQIEQDFALCRTIPRFKEMIVRAIATQFMGDDLIALFEFKERTGVEVELIDEKHYRLVEQDELSAEELEEYRREALRRE